MVTDVRPHPLPLTGERTLPDVREENYWFRRHQACYVWIAQRLVTHLPASSKRRAILDAGAGEGYGAALLATTTRRPVIAAELDAASALHTHRRYPDLGTVRANLVQLPLGDDSCASVVSLQVIEHLWDVRGYLTELTRCTRGPIAISTPNRLVHSPGLGREERPLNPFHHREFDADELAAELLATAPASGVVVYGLHHGPRITAWESANGSLPEALLSTVDAVRQSAQDFAADLNTQDFVITSDNTHDSSHDLVAWWTPQ